MKRILLIFTILTFFSLVKAQNFKLVDSNFIYIGISAGPSFPIGDFGSSNSNINDAGYAKTGALLNINFDYKLLKNAGATALLFGQLNQALSKPFAEITASKNPNIYFTAETKNWRIGGIMAGLFGSLPLDNEEKFIIEVKGLAGVLNITTPDIKITNNSNGTWTEEKPEFTNSFSFIFGTTVKYKISEKFLLMLNVNYLYSNPSINNLSYVSNTGFIDYRSFTQNLQEINTTVGITYKLK